MRAIVQNDYGEPADVLELRQIDTPAVSDDDVLIRVRAASIHAGDAFTTAGVPWLARTAVGIPKPKKNYVVGLDAAGVVETIGPNVTRFKPGDEVFAECSPRADGGGACAEYARATQDNVVAKPASLTFEQAAAIPVSALAALHGLRDAGKLEAGQHILINGAAGGVGTYAVQIAKALGADVTGVCSADSADMVRSIGADHVIDYTREDFTQGDARYDLVLDNVGNRSFSDVRHVLKPEGKVLPNTGHAGLGYVIAAALRSLYARQQARPFLSTPNSDDLEYLAQLAASGQLKPVIDRTYRLEQTPHALQYVSSGHAHGKVVITV